MWCFDGYGGIGQPQCVRVQTCYTDGGCTAMKVLIYVFEGHYAGRNTKSCADNGYDDSASALGHGYLPSCFWWGKFFLIDKRRQQDI
jgi:hypothetical protein